MSVDARIRNFYEALDEMDRDLARELEDGEREEKARACFLWWLIVLCLLPSALVLVFSTGCTLEVQDPYGGTARVTIGDGGDDGAASTGSTTESAAAKPTTEAPTGLVELGGEKVKPGLAKLFAAINRAVRLKRYREGRDIAQGLARAFGAALHKSGSGGLGGTAADEKPPKSDTELRADDAFDDMKTVIEESK